MPIDAIPRTDSISSSAVDDTLSPTMSERHVSDAPTPSKRQRLSTGLADRSVENDFKEIRYRDTTSNHQHGFSADADPLLVNATLSKSYLAAFMDYVNVPTFDVFPRKRFMHWAINKQDKSLRERIVLYAIMAMGSVHSTGPDTAAHRQIFKKIVYSELDRLESESYDLQLAHILLLLSFTDFVDAEHNTGFSAFVRAVGCVTWLQLNLEPARPSSDSVYGFPPDVHAECRRRTYWIAFSFDTYAALAKGDPRLLNKSDIYLRLPCASHFYENGQIPIMPVFDQENVLPNSLTTQQHLELSDMAYFLQITAIFSDVQLNSWRSQQSLRVGVQYYQERSVREKLEGRLKTWSDTYDEALRVKDARTRESEQVPRKSQESGTYTRRFAGLDLLYHYAIMELNRRIHHKSLSEAEVLQHAKIANVHAVETLRLAHQVMTRRGSETRDYLYTTRGPLGGFAVLTAIDIITAAGKNGDVLENQSKIMELMYASLNLLETLANYWSSAKIQRELVRERIQTVFSTAQTALGERKMFFYCTNSMTPLLEKELDLIYGTDRKQYLRAAYGMNNSVKDAEIYEIKTSDPLGRRSSA